MTLLIRNASIIAKTTLVIAKPKTVAICGG
jgi:hypothetical protein